MRRDLLLCVMALSLCMVHCDCGPPALVKCNTTLDCVAGTVCVNQQCVEADGIGGNREVTGEVPADASNPDLTPDRTSPPDQPVPLETCDNKIDDDGDGLTDCDDPDCSGHPQCQSNIEICTNKIDDDKDGLVDCDDPDCNRHPQCQSKTEICTNQIDDDGDGLIDCQDPDCGQHPSCITTQEICTNGVDDDRDGQIDCADPDCANHQACRGVENCSNGRDDDGDGLVDCNDPTCAQDAACQNKREICDNKIDDDKDQRIDCADPDCKSHWSCIARTEDCMNKRDDDGDGLIDCQDPDCRRHWSCNRPPEDCSNGRDDDGDGLADCQDPDCAAAPQCQSKTEICTNGRDDDGDGKVDCDDLDCAKDPACQSRQEVCDNKIDDDKDGLVDCDDPDCGSHPGCRGVQEVCDNNRDDDRDGLSDCKDPDCFAHPKCATAGKEICNNKLDDDSDGLADCDDPDCKSQSFCQKGPEDCTNGKDDDRDGATDCADPDCSNHASCVTKTCKPDVDFGTLAPRGARVTRSLTTTGRADALSSVCVTPGGGDIVGVFVLSATSDVQLSWSQSGDHSFAIYRAGLGQSCNQNPFRCVDPNSNKTGKETLLGMAAGRYYIIVEAYGKGLEGKVDITLSTGSATTKENCGNGFDDDGDGAIDCKDVECANSPLCSGLLCQPHHKLGAIPVNTSKSVSATTLNKTNVYDLHCANGGGKDVVISFVVPTPSGLDITARGAGGHVLGLVAAAGPGTRCDAGKVSCYNPAGRNSYRVLWNSIKPGTYYLIVDALKAGNEGSFSLTIRTFGKRGPELCNNKIDDDGDGAIDCLDTDCYGVGTCPGPVCKPGYSAGVLSPNGPGKSFQLDTRNENDSNTTTCSQGGGKEAVIAVELGAVSSLAVRCNQRSGADHAIALLSGHKPRDPCDKHPLSCVDIKTSPAGCSYAWPNLQPGKYYVIVESFKKGSEGPINLTLRAISGTAQEICNNGKDDDGDGLVDCADFNCASSPLCAGKTCTPDKTIGALTPGGASLNTAVTTTNAGDGTKSTCSTQTGQDAVISFSMAKQANLEVEYAQFGDHTIALYADKGLGVSCSASPQGCKITGAKANGKVIFNAVPTGKYFLIIDAEKGKEGSVLLKLTAK